MAAINDGTCDGSSPAPTSPSEERVMRAREVLAETPHADDCRYAKAMRGEEPGAIYFDCTCDRPIRAMLAFSDEGSGIGELREALRVMLTAFSPYADTVAKREAIAMAYATTSPDIDRSGLAQEVEQSRADQLLADDLDYVAGKPVE